MLKPHMVIAVLTAKQGKEFELETSLKEVARLSRLDKTNMEYRLYKSTENLQQFILFENWENEEKHQEHLLKPYVKEFIEKLGDLLATPYQGFAGKEI